MGRIRSFEKAVNFDFDFDSFIFLKAEEILLANGISLKELQYSGNYLNKEEAYNITNIINSLKSYDCELFYHCLRVGVFATVIGNVMFPKYVGELFIGGLIHDIGKVFIPNHVLYKKERLTNAEFDLIKNHTIIGNSFLIRSGVTNKDILDISKYHHRQYNGTGYPEIDSEYNPSPLTEIISVADSFDAMVNKRVYSTAKTIDEAVAELVNCSGKQFNPDMVDVFKRYANIFKGLATRG